MNLKEQDLTKQIIGGCFEVSNELGCGFLEGVYERALLVALRDRGLSADSQVPLEVRFRDETVGQFYADLVVEEAVIVELKAVSALAPEHEAQVPNYLKASGISVALLVNFGKPRLEYKRFVC